jgi:hypothetical protein
MDNHPIARLDDPRPSHARPLTTPPPSYLKQKNSATSTRLGNWATTTRATS